MSTCRWCGRAFTPRINGGKPQYFCRAACRRALDAAGRRWIAAALADGSLTIDALRTSIPETRALPIDAKAGPSASDAADTLLDLFIALPEPILFALPDELFERIAVCLEMEAACRP